MARIGFGFNTRNKRRKKRKSTRRPSAKRRASINTKRLIISLLVLLGIGFGVNKYKNREPQPEDQQVSVDDAANDVLGNESNQTAQQQTTHTTQVDPEETGVAPEPVEPAPHVVSPPVAKPDVKTEPSALELIADAADDANANKIIASRDKFNAALRLKLSRQSKAIVKSQMADLSKHWLSSNTSYPQDELTDIYVVQSGDLLERIGRKYHVPYEIIMQLNGITRPELLRAGAKLKIVKGPFRGVVHLSSFTMDLYLQDTYVKTYKVAIGKIGSETPVGAWRVQKGGRHGQLPWPNPETHQMVHPDDPEYPLGEKYIAIEGTDEKTKSETGFALHGTNDPKSIGTAASAGCIRFLNKDIIELYGMLTPILSTIEIKE